MNTTYLNVDAIKAQYAPYNKHPQFEQGFVDCLNGQVIVDHGYCGVAGQAYDRGADAGNKVLLMSRWIDENVGLD